MEFAKIYGDKNDCEKCGDGTIARWNYMREGMKLCDEHMEELESSLETSTSED